MNRASDTPDGPHRAARSAGPGDSRGPVPPANLRESVWWDAPPAQLPPERPPLDTRGRPPLRTRTAIVGAGIAGAALAAELARRGDDVVLLEGLFPGAGATGRNAGFLLAESDCFTLTARHVGEPAARALREAGLATRDLVHRLTQETKTPLDLAWTGSLRLATDRVEAAHFHRTAAAAAAGTATAVAASAPLDGLHVLGPKDLARHVPESGHSPTAGPYHAALIDDGDGVVHPLALLTALLEDAERHGARRFDHTPVARLDPRATAGARARRAPIAITTPHGTLHADRVVLAVNAAARLVLPADVARAIRPVRAQALAATVTPAPHWPRPVYATRGGDYWRALPRRPTDPASTGRVLIGGLRRLDRPREATRSLAPTEPLQTALDALLRRLLGPAAEIQVTHRWAGTMAFTPDGLPWVGPLPDAPRVHLLAGFNGHGMGWAPGLAAALAEDLMRPAASRDPTRASGPAAASAAVPSCFRPSR